MLCDTHGLLRGKVQDLGRLLLQSTGCKWKWGLLSPLPFSYFGNLELGILERLSDLFFLLGRMNHQLLLFRPIKLGAQRLFLSLYFQNRIQRPVLFRNKGVDLRLPIRNDTKSNRLNTTGA